MSEVETSSTGFRRGGKQRSSLPVVRTPSKTLERPLGNTTPNKNCSTIIWRRAEFIRGAEAQGYDCNATVLSSILTRENQFLFINVSIKSLWQQRKTRRGVEFRQSTRNASETSAESRVRNILPLGSLCLPCCVRDTA